MYVTQVWVDYCCTGVRKVISGSRTFQHQNTGQPVWHAALWLEVLVGPRGWRRTRLNFLWHRKWHQKKPKASWSLVSSNRQWVRQDPCSWKALPNADIPNMSPLPPEPQPSSSLLSSCVPAVIWLAVSGQAGGGAVWRFCCGGSA